MMACTLIHTHSLTNKKLNKSPRWFIGGFKYKLLVIMVSLPLVCAMSVSSQDQHLSVVSWPVHSILDAVVLDAESAVLLPLTLNDQLY